MNLSEREKAFRRQVQEIGGTIYTQEMLNRFISYWIETDRAKKPKMRFEKERTWRTDLRLALWARNNYDKIVVYLTESEKTIAQKKHSFAVSLEPFLEQYGRETLNAFYKFWSQPENKPNPTMIRYESEHFWSNEARLDQWVKRKRDG
jgi:hypothetical protein